MIDLCLSRIILFTCALRHVNGGWIDPDTDDAFKSTAAFTLGDDREYALVSQLERIHSLSEKHEVTQFFNNLRFLNSYY